MLEIIRSIRRLWTPRRGDKGTKLVRDAAVLQARLKVAGEMIRNRRLSGNEEVEISFIESDTYRFLAALPAKPDKSQRQMAETLKKQVAMALTLDRQVVENRIEIRRRDDRRVTARLAILGAELDARSGR